MSLALLTPAEAQSGYPSAHALLTLAELRTAAGFGVGGTDDEVTALGDGIALAVARHCGVASAGLAPPTLRKETLVETVRLDAVVTRLILRRRFISVLNVEQGGTALDLSQIEVEAGAGMVSRLSAGGHAKWCGGPIAVTYEAGFDDVPADIRMAAILVARQAISAQRRDLAVKVDAVNDVDRVEYFDPTIFGADMIPPAAMRLLAAYKTENL
ncbi:hypothetical protein [Kaistia terrae]|uniref:Phage gp6-like head-tail connector protein n=1 Tax=Kaistia terrae TaxID=537017 RepID=A0ABW0Q394_9HYPH|nr:hypothetical protein [Kaistia terrae]MCX5581328.1 hypothetical protein [Kaistia terrae]